MPREKDLLPPSGPAQALSLPDNYALAPEHLKILHVRKIVLMGLFEMIP